jgi:hypothetical protein
MRKEYLLFDNTFLDTDDFTEPFYDEELIEAIDSDLLFEELEGDHETYDYARERMESVAPPHTNQLIYL